MVALFSPHKLLRVGACAFLILLFGCAHKKESQPLTQQSLHAKKVALAEIKGSKEARTQFEVSLVNAIIEKGHFEIIDRATVQEALAEFPAESDWKQLGERLGADYILAIDVTEYKVDEKQGVDRIEEEDSLLTEEQHSKQKLKGMRYVKVKAYHGQVTFTGKFFNVHKNAMAFQGEGKSSDLINSRDRDFPKSKLLFLEGLANRAVDRFFEQMPKE